MKNTTEFFLMLSAIISAVSGAALFVFIIFSMWKKEINSGIEEIKKNKDSLISDEAASQN